jgi:trans-2,3-dihydro-3-hydroxyanthranilate isomerase
MRLDYVRVDVFTERAFAGNQLAVFAEVDERVVAAATMQALAAELALSESTFVVGRNTEAGTARVRIFTPEVELRFAGHPTLGTAALLADTGVMALELGVGRVPVRVEKTSYGWRAELTAPPAERLALARDPVELATEVGLDAAALATDLPVEAWSCGNPFTLVPVRDRAAVGLARPSARAARAGEPLGIVVFCVEGAAAVHARVLIPGSRVPEDPATGSANAPLCAYLHTHGRLALGATLTTTQGVEMGRPSTLWARLERDGDGVLRPRVAGGVVRVGGGTIEL